jgi:hypothetical protein
VVSKCQYALGYQPQQGDGLMIRVVLLFQPGEAKAMRTMCNRFTFQDALQFLHRVPNVAPHALCEGVNKLRAALDAVGDSSQSP